MTVIFCACCGRPFHRTSTKGPPPRYCSTDCRKQMAVRRSTWGSEWTTFAGDDPVELPVAGGKDHSQGHSQGDHPGWQGD